MNHDLILQQIEAKSTALYRERHCKNGHPRTPENTIVSSTTGVKSCRPCRKASDDQRRIREREKKDLAVWK